MAPTALFCWRLEHAHPELPSTRLTFALCWPQFPSGCCWFNVSNFKFLERKTASFPPACQFGGNIICPVALPDGGGCCWKKFISFFGWCREEDGLCLWYDQELWDLGMSCQPIRAGRQLLGASNLLNKLCKDIRWDSGPNITITMHSSPKLLLGHPCLTQPHTTHHPVWTQSPATQHALCRVTRADPAAAPWSAFPQICMQAPVLGSTVLGGGGWWEWGVTKLR